MEPFHFQSAQQSMPIGRRTSITTSETKWSLHDMDLQNRGSLRTGRKHSNISFDGTSRRRYAADHTFYDPEADISNAREMAKRKRQISFWTLFRYAKWFDILLMVVGGTVAVLSGIIVPWIFFWCGKLLLVMIWDARCSHHLPAPEHLLRLKEEVRVFLINVCVGGVALFASNYVSWRCFAWSADLQMKRIASNYFEWILRKDLAWFDIYVDKEFSNLMNEELTQIRFGIGENLAALINLISTNLCIIVLTILLHYRLALFLFSMGPLFYILSYLVTYSERRQREESAKGYARAAKFAEDVLCCIKMVKVFQGERTEVKRFSRYLRITAKAQLHWILVASFCTGIIWLCVYTEMAGAIAISTSTIHIANDFCTSINSSIGIPHRFDLELFHPEGPQSYAIVLLSMAFVGSHSLDSLFYILQIIEAKRRAAEVFFLIDWKPRIDNMSQEGTTPKGFAIGKVEFSNVGFKYPRSPDDWVFRDATFIIYPRQVIGVFGKETAGKSTILKLIMRLYDTCEGQITLDGVDIQYYNVMWLRAQMCFISHETLVFPVTITENLQLVKPDCSIAEIHEACKIAEIHDRILELPNGYDTILTGGNHFTKLNPDELIKIAVARALIVKPRILLIDEKPITSNEKLENVIVKLIQRLRNKCTIVVSASRANAVMKHCDHIYYFENGEIVDHGTHLELLLQKGPYYKMVEATLDTVADIRMKCTSQLTAYKFAKSLRRSNERKRQIRENTNVDALELSADEDKMLNIMTHPLDEQERKQFYYTGFGYGGFHKYTFAKNADFNPAKIFQLFRKSKSNRPAQSNIKRKRTKASLSKAEFSKSRRNSQVSFRERSDSISIAQEQARKTPKSNLKKNDIMRPQNSEIRVKINDVGSGGMNVDRASTASILYSINIGNDDEFDNVSICSEDSEEFWEDYSDKIESLRHDHEVGSWFELLKLTMVKGSRLWIVLGTIASIVLGLAAPVIDVLIGETCLLFTYEDEVKRKHRMIGLALAFVCLGGICGFAAFSQELCFSLAGSNICTGLRAKLFTAMLNQDLEWFDMTESDISILCVRLSSDVDTIQHVLMTTLGVILQNVTTVMSSIVVAVLMFNAWEGQRQIILALSFVTLSMIFLAYCSGTLVYNHIEMMESRLESSSEISYHTIANIKTCVVLALEKYFIVQFNKAIDKPFRCFYLLSELRCITSSISKALPWIVAGFFVYASFQYSPKGHYPDIRYLFIVMELMIFRCRNVGEVLSLLTKSSLGKIAAHRINKILKSNPMVTSTSNAVKRNFDDTPLLELVDIRYNYSSEADVLKGINLTIQPNSYSAVIGQAESGKTTLANIILRLLKPTSGKILINGEDVENINIEYLRNIMAIVEQDPAILHDMSIVENIKFGNNPNLTEEEIVGAAKAAKVHFEIMSFKHGYQTKMYSRSSAFSYTFKHKLSLARALVRNPKILIVDDIVISSDSEHDSAMKTAIRDSSTGRTVLLFSQKVAPIRQADIIYVLNDGVIEEIGSHSTLLDMQGTYYEMYMVQRMLVSAAALNVNQGANETEILTIDTLKRHATANAKRKSSVAYTKFLAIEMERVRNQLKQRGEAMKEEEEMTKIVKKLHLEEDDDDDNKDTDRNKK